MTASQADLLGGVLAFVFTLALLGYLIGDNPLYRIALHTFIGISVGYIALVVIYQVIQPRLIASLQGDNRQMTVLAVIPLIIFLFLILKLHPRTAALGNIGVGFLVGVGTATALGGVLTGTLLPQISASWVSILPDFKGVFLDNLIILIGTISTLLYFQFWLQMDQRSEMAVTQSRFLKLANIAGKGFLVLTLGVVYGGMILSGIVLFGERLLFLFNWLN